MGNRKGKFNVYTLCILVLLVGICLILKNFLEKWLQNNQSEGFSNITYNEMNSLIAPQSTLELTNYINLDKPIHSNEDYKKNISCHNVPSPSLDGSIRVNYYNS